MKVPNDIIEIDRGNIKGMLHKYLQESMRIGKDIQVIAYIITPEAEQILGYALKAVLKKHNLSHLEVTAAFILRELVTNAVKANVKQILQKKGLSGSELIDALRDVLHSTDMLSLRPQLKAAWLYVEISFISSLEHLTISVRNKAVLNDAEKMRLHGRVRSAETVDNLRQMFEDNRSDAEGGGLGLALMYKSLVSAGISGDALKFDFHDPANVTVSISFPISPSHVYPQAP